jgi:hypothetical protein
MLLELSLPPAPEQRLHAALAAQGEPGTLNDIVLRGAGVMA